MAPRWSSPTAPILGAVLPSLTGATDLCCDLLTGHLARFEVTEVAGSELAVRLVGWGTSPKLSWKSLVSEAADEAACVFYRQGRVPVVVPLSGRRKLRDMSMSVRSFRPRMTRFLHLGSHWLVAARDAKLGGPP